MLAEEILQVVDFRVAHHFVQRQPILWPEISKFPVFFPVSRELDRRRVSARLRPPPRSLNCRENPQPFPPKYAKDAHISRLFPHEPDCREGTADSEGVNFQC